MAQGLLVAIVVQAQAQTVVLVPQARSQVLKFITLAAVEVVLMARKALGVSAAELTAAHLQMLAWLILAVGAGEHLAQ